MASAGLAVDVPEAIEAAKSLELQKQRAKVEAERENSVQEEVGVMNIAPRRYATVHCQ